MKAFRFLIVILALVVAGSGMSVDAKKRKSRKRVAKKTVVEPAPTGYDYIVNEDESPAFNFDEVKYHPEYPGGNEGLSKFLSENIKYPKSARDKGVQGRVIVQFIVEKTGAISNIKVLKSVDPALDKEAVRVVSQITRFVPGYDKDHAPVRVLYALPVNFKLN